MARRIPDKVYKMPNEAGLKRILEELGEEERLALAAAALRHALQPLRFPLTVGPDSLATPS